MNNANTNTAAQNGQKQQPVKKPAKPEQMPDIEDKRGAYTGEDLPNTTDNPHPGIKQKGQAREKI